MHEQLQIQKQPYFRPPTSPTNHNKLQQYFESSSFLSQQDQLSIFIRDFPIIHLKQLKSINGLISLLIKQNELLGAKCQQQINLLKQQYQKYDKMLKANKEMKNQKQKLQKQKRELFESYNTLKFESQKQNLRREELQSQERKIQAEFIKTNSLLKQTNLNLSALQQVIDLVVSQDYKKCEEALKTNHHFANKQKIQEYCQMQKKKNRYLSKIKGVVEQFCLRLQKIIKVVSPTVLAAELSTESRAMIELISDICEEKGKRKKKTSQRHLTTQSDLALSMHKGNGTFFENLIQKLIQCSSSTTATKEAIAFQLEQVRNSLTKSKSQYETAIKNIQNQFKQREEESLKKLFLKEETIKYYEQEIQKCRQTNKRIKQQLQSSIANLHQLRREAEEKNSLLHALESRISDLNKQQKEQLERVKNDCESRVQELKKTAAMKIDQRQQIINEYADRRKSEQTQYENQISELKVKIKNLQDELEQKQGIIKVNNKNFFSLQSEHLKKQSLLKELLSAVQKNKVDLNDLQDKLKRKGKQAQDFKETLNSLNHEKSLQTAYISELEAKIQSLNSKIRNLESKTKNEIFNKKEMAQIKNAMVEEKQRNEQYQSYCAQVKEENHRLKSVIKEMKKELEEVYIKLNQLKQIEAEREKLYSQAENSDRIKESLSKKNEELKFQMLKLETENKKIHLQLKHYKNIVSRIRFNQEES